MSKLDKLFTHKLWIIVISIVLIIWFVDGTKKSAPLIVFVVIIALILLWALLILANPHNITGVIKWKSGNITRTGVFSTYNDYELWLEDTYRREGHLIENIWFEKE